MKVAPKQKLLALYLQQTSKGGWYAIGRLRRKDGFVSQKILSPGVTPEAVDQVLKIVQESTEEP